MGISPKRKWERLYHALRGKILDGTYVPGQEIPSHTELAQEYAASVPTVRQAISALIRDQMLVSIQGKGSFVSDQFRPPPVSVGVVAPAAPGYYQAYRAAKLMEGITTGARAAGLSIEMYTVVGSSGASSETAYREVLAQAKGVIVLPGTPDSVYHWCRERDIPAVLADGNKLHTDIPQVSYDRQGAVGMAVEYLHSLGHRRIACILAASGPYSGGTAEERRLAGFLDAVRNFSLDLPAGYLVRCQKQVGVLRTATSGLLDCPVRPSAVCCSTDRIASAVMSVFIEREIRVPEDISLMCLTDCSDWEYPQIVLTGVRTPFEEVGAEAAKMLRALIDGTAVPQIPLMVPSDLVMGNSCGGPAGG